MIITIDGPAGSGKSTVSRAVAAALGFIYVDTGAMYRAVALAARRQGVAPDDDQGLAGLCERIALEFRTVAGAPHMFLDGRDVEQAIRTSEASMAASKVSARPAVRRAMVGLQRRMGAAGGVVMEGRDIGTNVFPDAEVKLFLIADDNVRARRRNLELRQRGIVEDLQATLDKMRERDADDAGRELAPLRRAADAVELDTSELTLDQVIQAVLRIVASARKK